MKRFLSFLLVSQWQKIIECITIVRRLPFVRNIQELCNKPNKYIPYNTCNTFCCRVNWIRQRNKWPYLITQKAICSDRSHYTAKFNGFTCFTCSMPFLSCFPQNIQALSQICRVKSLRWEWCKGSNVLRESEKEQNARNSVSSSQYLTLVVTSLLVRETVFSFTFLQTCQNAVCLFISSVGQFKFLTTYFLITLMEL